MDIDSDSGDFDADFDAEGDYDYEYDEDGDIEMEFETEADVIEDSDVERDPDQDIEYDLVDQSVESTWSLWHADSDEQENGYWVESDQEDPPDDDHPDEDQPESDNVKTATESMAAQQKHSIEILEERSNLTVATGGHNRDKREWYSRQEYHSEDYDDEEDEEEDEDQDTPSKRINRLMAGLPRLFFAIPPEEGDYE